MPSTPPSSSDQDLRSGLPYAVDTFLAALGLLAAAPLLALLALAIKLSSPGPVFFRQQRVGRGGELFTLIKLRSMRLHQTGSQVTSSGDQRITAVGRLLRKTKLDELPELWNVVRGDMALVGPRPEVPRYVDLDNPHWRAVLRARPGLTDPTTLRLRNEETLMAQVEGDPEDFYRQTLLPYKLGSMAAYLGRRTAWSDLRVLFETGWRVLIPSQAPPPSLEEIRQGFPSDDSDYADPRRQC